MTDIAYPILERTLSNGLRVVVSPDHTVPAVTVNLWVGVGSKDESAGRTGLAHLFEHLMFQGSRNVASGEHFSALMAQGGRLNATTWFDRTNYFETVPTGAFELALWLEADRHGHLLDAVTQENLDNQRDVVKEEKRQRYDNMPYGTALIDIYATVFPGRPPLPPPDDRVDGRPRRRDPGGRARVLPRVLRARTTPSWPSSATSTPDEAFAAVERYFGGLPASAQPPGAVRHPLPPLSEPVRFERTSQVPNDRLYLAFRLPVDTTHDFLAASLALDVLGGLNSSRLSSGWSATSSCAPASTPTPWAWSTESPWL